MKYSWDIFCSVVDNYGDIGVCWRLARQLAAERGQSVRLFVDDLASFRQLCPSIVEGTTQTVAGVEVCHWIAGLPATEPARIVVEGFGVKLPESYLTAMAARQPAPVWINLEHISAEPWVDGYHALPSPHPTLPLTKYFFFPGFTGNTGGVLIERNLAPARRRFQSDSHERGAFLQLLGLDAADAAGLCVSLFCYENAALAELLAEWADGAQPLTCIVPAGRALAALTEAGHVLKPGQPEVRGQLKLIAIPFLDVDRYDRLLWACDVNFVRGEDSFVRAQLAARPLVWQAYIQPEGAHLPKQAAFLDRYLEGLDHATADAWRSLHNTWNTQSAGVGGLWRDLLARRTAAASHAQAWAARLIAAGDLATKLTEFCQDRLK